MYMEADEPPCYSLLPSDQDSSLLGICCITLAKTNKIRLIGTLPELTDPIRESIKSSWGLIDKERTYEGAHEFKLKGSPWSSKKKDSVHRNSIRSRRLVTSVLRTMAQRGWNLVQAADISKRTQDRDSLFFEYLGGVDDPSMGQAMLPPPPPWSRPSTPSTTTDEEEEEDVAPSLESTPQPLESTPVQSTAPAREIDMFAISFNRTNRIRLIDAPTHIPPLVKEAIKKQWRLGIQQEKDHYGSLEFHLNGDPFYAAGTDNIHLRMMLSQILAVLSRQGYRLYTSVDVHHGGDGDDLNSWIFRHVDPIWP